MKVFLGVYEVENKLYRTKEAIADTLDFPRDVVLDIPKITITGDNEIIIENHKGIVIFEENQIKINSKAGLVTINGERFEILFIGGSTITLSGHFRSIIYDEYEKSQTE